MRNTSHVIKGFLFSILSAITFLFLLFIPAYAVDSVPIEAAPIADAPIQAEPLPEAELIAPDESGLAAPDMAGSTPSTDGEFGEAGTSVSAPTTNTYSGSASFSIPISVLPGRLGVAPSISLSYSSLAGNGFLGVGWNLDMGSIQCRTKNGVTYPCTEFVFSKGGSTSDLICKTGNEYQAKIEDGSFIRFFKNGSGGNITWTALDKNGMTYYYGTASGSPQYSRLDDSTGAKIFKWALDKVTDASGNYMTLSYYKDPTYREIYLSQIDYTGNTNTGLPTTNRIIFNRDSGTRPDVQTSYYPRFTVRTSYRLSSIEVRANISGTYQLSRKYVLNYTTAPSSNRSVLSSVLLYGSDGTATMPQTVFSYQPGQPGLDQDEYWYGHSEPYAGGSGGFRLADVNGDGIADFVFDAEDGLAGAYIKVFLGNGADFEPIQQWSHRLYAFDGKSKGFRLADMNGDGLPDYVYDNNGYIRVLLNTGNGSFKADTDSAIWGVRTANHYNGTGIRIADVNGDGLPEIIYDNSLNGYKSIHVLLNTGSSLATDSIWGSHSQHPGDSSGGFQMVDMNGDGKADYVYENSKNVRVLLSNGNGFNTETLWGVKAKAYDNDCPGIRLADMNGDGLPDLVYDGGNKEIHLLISTGGGFNTDVIWGLRTQGYQTNSGCFQVADMNGDGLADFLYEDGSRNIRVLLNTDSHLATDNSSVIWGVQLEGFRDASPGLRIGDVNGDGLPDLVYDSDTGGNNIHVLKGLGPVPDLISTVSNGVGGTFGIIYAPSSTPLVRTHETLPFVLQTVSSITADDGFSLEPSTTSYTYSGGFYHLADREFRGFGYSKQINPDNTTFETWHHQRDTGAWYWDGTAWINWPNCYDTMVDDDDFKGKPCHTELKDPNGVMLSQTDMPWTRSVPLGQYPVFVKPASKTITAYVGGVTVASTETYTYDTSGSLTQVRTTGPDADPITTDNVFQAFGSGGTYPIRQTETKVSVTGAQDWIRKTTFDYDSAGRMLWKKVWLDNSTSITTDTLTYYPNGNLFTKKDALNRITTFSYDSTQTFVSRTDYPTTGNGAVTHFEQATYNYHYGKPATKLDENFNTTTFGYDYFGRPNESASYQGNEISGTLMAKTKTDFYDFEFQSTGKPNYVKKRVLETNTGGETYIDASVFVDGFGRTIQTISTGENNTPIVSNAYYDNMGRANIKEGPFFGSGFVYNQTAPQNVPLTITTFDYFGKPVQIESADGDYGSVISEVEYTGLSTTIYQPRASADPNRIVAKTEAKDYFGRIIQVIEYNLNDQQQPEQYYTDYLYNAAGDLLSVTDNDNNTTNMSYDKIGRKETMTDPDMGDWSYHYYADGSLWYQTDAKNQTITFTYDELNRVKTKTYSSGEPTVNYVYDNLSILNGRGRLYSVSNTTATTVYTEYDALGRVKSSTKTIQGDSTQYITSTSYDLPGRPVTMTYPGGSFSVTNTYHSGTGLLNTVTAPGVVYAAMSNYTPSGKIGQMDQNNSKTTTTYTYDPKSTKLTDIVAKLTSADPNNPLVHIINREYFYSPAGDINSIIDKKKGRQLGLPNDAFVYTYTYDKLHRFNRETTTNNVYSQMDYTYNAIGNILKKEVVGSTRLDYTYDPVKKHAVKTIQVNNGTIYNFDNDLNGNMTSGYDLTDLQNIAARTLTYNADNMPVSVTHARYGTTTISYDGTSNRVKKVSPSGTTYYIGEHYEVINNDPIKYIFAGNLRVAKISPVQGIKYFHKDHLGSSAAMTNEAGTVQETSNYMPFGEMREHSGIDLSNYKFTDQEFDPESGLYYYGARYYDPTIGRFISPDSVVQDPYDPQTLNRYTYCRNNPIIYTDPDGHIFGIDDAVIIVAAVIGAVTAGIQSDWNVGAMLAGAAIGAISAGVYAGVQGAVASALKGMVSSTVAGALSGAAGGASAGIVAGGLSAAINGGNIGQGMLMGGLIGGVMGGVIGAIEGAGTSEAQGIGAQEGQADSALDANMMVAGRGAPGPTCPPKISSFLADYGAGISKIAQTHEINSDLLITLSGHESGWGKSPGAVDKHNIWGIGMPKPGGGRMVRPFTDIAEGNAYWSRHFGAKLSGIKEWNPFVSKLKEIYNFTAPYAKDIGRTWTTWMKYKPYCAVP